MKSILLFLCMSLVYLSIGQEDYPIYKNVREVVRYNVNGIPQNSFFVSSEFAKPDLQANTDLNLTDKEIVKVIYLYSKNNNNPEFKQDKLSNMRYQKLMNMFPELANESVQWKTLVQNGCKTDECSSKLSHGFIVFYEDKVIEEEPLIEESPKKVIDDRPIMGHDQLRRQSFKINANQESMIEGRDGTKILFPANCLVDGRGRQVNGMVTVNLKEALDIENIVFGDLTTVTSDGQMLESKGMVEIRARKGSQQLELRDGAEITVSIPTGFEEGFNHFKGNEEGGDLTWNEPVPIKEDAGFKVKNGKIKKDFFKHQKLDFVEEVRENGELVALKFRDRPWNFWGTDNSFNIEKSEFSRRYTKKHGLKMNYHLLVKKWFEDNAMDRDEMVEAGGWWKLKRRSLFGWGLRWWKNNWDGKVDVWTIEDEGVANVFRMGNLGWANIDRLAKMRNARPVRFNVSLESETAIEEAAVSIRLIVPRKNIFIPGFQRPNGNYAFTHGEYEDIVRMPIGEKVIVMATAETDSLNYFGIKEMKIGKADVQSMKIEPTDRESMISQMKEHIKER